MILKDLFSKVVFLIGAGASKEPGCLLSNDMLFKLNEILTKKLFIDSKYEKYIDDFREIYHFIMASMKYQTEIKANEIDSVSYVNIEDFVMVLRQLIDKEYTIPYPLIGNWNDKITKWELRNNDIFSQFLEFITCQLITSWTRFDLTKAKKLLQPIRTILDKSEDFKINIFSLNYDLIFESVFNSQTTRLLDNGFSEKRIDDSRIHYWSMDFDNPQSPTKINLFKLHGSIDWVYGNDSEEVFMKSDPNETGEPLMIFGSYSKMLSFDPFLYMLSSFRSKLEQSSLFITIGYSFHDKHINNLLIQQLNQNTTNGMPKRLLIIDPFLDKTSNVEFVNKLRVIQENKSINDVINFRRVSPERVRIIPTSAQKFFTDYFKDNGKLLQNQLVDIERSVNIFS